MKHAKVAKKDIRILSYIAEYKFLTVKQISALNRRSSQTIRRRLRHLSGEGLILSNERGIGNGPGRREHIVILTQKGIKFLNARGLLSRHAFSSTNKKINPLFIEHDLMMNWFFIHLAQLTRNKCRFLIQHLTNSSHDLKDGNTDYPLLMEKFFYGDNSKETICMVPDGIFTITDKGAGKSLLFYLEVDMGTETLVNSNRSPGDIREKIINYQTLFSSNRYKRYEKIFKTKFNGFRLLFVTNTSVRMKALCGLIQRMPPKDFIWVTEINRIFSKGISAPIWARGGQYENHPESILGQTLAFESKISMSTNPTGCNKIPSKV